MKNNKVLGALLTASFCASTMTACGVYGAPEDYEEVIATEAEESDVVISTEKENNDTEMVNSDTEYCPDKSSGASKLIKLLLDSNVISQME